MRTRILIADDNPLFRRTLKRILESVDHWEIIETQDGDEAVRKSLETSPDLIVLDLAMPVKDGLTAAREISQALPHTPLLMCTMHASAQLEIEAQKSGVRQVIPKSESSIIVPAIRQLLGKNPVIDSVAATAATPVLLADSPSGTDRGSTVQTSRPSDLPPIPPDPGSETPTS
jgi:DNA-binding NarL/FixJ family response regulator